MNRYAIEKLRISGFRRLRDVELPMKPFTVLIGANGVGKTSILDALSLLSASASSNLNAKLSEFGGVSNLLTRGKNEKMLSRKDDRISLCVDMKVPDDNPFNYELKLKPAPLGYSIASEELSQNRLRDGHSSPKFVHLMSLSGDVFYVPDENIRPSDVTSEDMIRPTWEHSPLETSLAQVPKTFKQPETFRNILATTHQYHTLDVSPRAPVKLPQPMKPATMPGIDGENLSSYLYCLRESNSNRYEVIIDTLKAAFPHFDSFSFPPVAAGMLTTAWNDNRLNEKINIHELSEGTLRFIWLVSLLHSPQLPTITMIDEPEVSLHPELLSILVDVMREASERTQLIVATHSDRLVRFLEPSEVVVMDTDDEGYATATWADDMDLDAWLAEYSLDEVWRMGRMGGRA
jgi:predicted ATPase